MPIFTVYGRETVFSYKNVDAESEEEAIEIAETGPDAWIEYDGENFEVTGVGYDVYGRTDGQK